MCPQAAISSRVVILAQRLAVASTCLAPIVSTAVALETDDPAIAVAIWAFGMFVGGVWSFHGV